MQETENFQNNKRTVRNLVYERKRFGSALLLQLSTLIKKTFEVSMHHKGDTTESDREVFYQEIDFGPVTYP